jgi:hypothetical protein
VVADAIMAHASKLPDAVAKAVESSRRPFTAHVAEMVDLIGYHELGHLYVGELGIGCGQRKARPELKHRFRVIAVLQAGDGRTRLRIAASADRRGLGGGWLAGLRSASRRTLRTIEKTL